MMFHLAAALVGAFLFYEDVMSKRKYEDFEFVPGSVECFSAFATQLVKMPSGPQNMTPFEYCCNQGIFGEYGNPACFQEFRSTPVSFRDQQDFFRTCCHEVELPSSIDPSPRLQERVVVAVTSIPPRLSHLHLVAESLLRQSYAPDRVYLVLPYRWKRTG